MASTSRDTTQPAGVGTDLASVSTAVTDTLFGRLAEMNADLGEPVGASLSADIAAMATAAAIGAGTDAAVQPGVAGSVQGHLREAQENIDTIKTEVDKIGAATDAIAAAGAAGSVHAHVRDVQTQIGLGTDAGTADGALGTVHSKLRVIGTPAGASVSADVAAVKVDTAAIKVQTDKLGAPAGASHAADVAAVKTEVDKIGAATDVAALAGAAGSLHAHIRGAQVEVQKIGAPAGASVSADIASVTSTVGTIATNQTTMQGVIDKAMVEQTARRFGNATVTKTNPTSYLTPIWNGLAAPTTETAYLVEQAFTANKLYVRMAGTVDQNVIVTVRKNFADTTITCTLTANTDSAKSDLAHSVAFAVGDQISIKVGIAVASSTDPTAVAALVLGTV